MDRSRINWLGSSYNNRPSAMCCIKEEEEKTSKVLTSKEFATGKISLNGRRSFYMHLASKGDE
jgi:hypothetical protein